MLRHFCGGEKCAERGDCDAHPSKCDAITVHLRSNPNTVVPARTQLFPTRPGSGGYGATGLSADMRLLNAVEFMAFICHSPL